MASRSSNIEVADATDGGTEAPTINLTANSTGPDAAKINIGVTAQKGSPSINITAASEDQPPIININGDGPVNVTAGSDVTVISGETIKLNP